MMRLANPRCTDDEFIHYFEKFGPLETARKLDTDVRKIFERRRRIEQRYAINLKPPEKTGKAEKINLPFSIEPLQVSGAVVIFSDAHFWPDIYTDAFWILLQVIKELKPQVVINNGDSFDGARISRHGRIGWDKRPTVEAEVFANTTCLTMIEEAYPEAQRFWNWGNHDLRFDTYLSTHAGEMEGVKGTSLTHHFSQWKFQWGLMINENCIIKHRHKSGTHAGHNNTLWAGTSMVTGHDHRLQVTNFSDYRGTRYGVQAGTLAQINGPMFDYTEGAPVNWQAGFIVGHFDGEDHRFESVEVRNGYARFGGRKWTPGK